MIRSLFLSTFLLLATACATPTLETKLQKQWANYGKAQDLLIERVREPSPRLISRDEWERAIRLTGSDALTAADLETLRQEQRRRIEAARHQAVAESKLDLQALRSLPPEKAQTGIARFCAELPKGAMLHVHPWGTVDRQTADELLTRQNPVLPIDEILKGIAATQGNSTLEPAEIQGLEKLGERPSYLVLSTDARSYYRGFLFLPPGKQPFPRFNSVFHFLGTAITSSATYEKALMDFAKRAVKEGVIYVEFTGGFSQDLVKSLQRIEKRTDLVIRVNQSFNRTHSAEDLGAQARTLLQQPESPWLVGIDFLDNEEGNPALEKGQLLYGLVLSEVRAGRSKLRRTMHSGEIGDIRNPRDALLLGAERLGHGVNLHQDPVTLEYAALRKVPVEINLASNLRLTPVPSIRVHPFLDYLRLGLPISLSTDDEGIFDTDIRHECVLAVSETDITYAEMKRMSFNSIDAAFATESERAALRKKLEGAFARFERRWIKP